MKNNFKLDECDDFVLLSASELRCLLVDIENLLLEYRSSISLPKNVTFGVEIEYESNKKQDIDKFILDNFSTWQSIRDGSIIVGGEITSPIMHDKLNYWQELEKICCYLSSLNVKTTNLTGGHIHLGVDILGNDIESWQYFLKIYMAYESIIFRFAAGDKQRIRPGYSRYALPIATLLNNKLQKINDINSIDDLSRNVLSYISGRYHAVNFTNIKYQNIDDNLLKNTIEFRIPNGTVNHIVWQNNINTFAKMLLSCKNKAFDIDFIDYKINNEFIRYTNQKYEYNAINLRNALELADLIFDNNLDKMYFLRQYLRSFQVETKVLDDEITYCKKFTK